MTRTELCLLPAVIGCLGAAFIGCDNSGQSGESDDIVYYERVPEEYEVCFQLSADLGTLAPTVACDRDGQTAYSFNIEVAGGVDQDGEPCGFSFSHEAPVSVRVDGSFDIFEAGGDPDADPVVRGRIQGDAADGEAVIVLGEGANCSILWGASTGPVCREDNEAKCQMLLDCCDSIELIPPILGNCVDVVNDCDGVECLKVLAGYTQCAQPPVCSTEVDPNGDCELLQECCDSTNLSKADLDACLATAEVCDPDNCENLLATYPDCTQPTTATVPSVSAE